MILINGIDSNNQQNMTKLCYYRKGQSYAGKQNITENELPCLNWNLSNYSLALYPNVVRKYCRNTQGYGAKPWCYVAEGKWKYCNVKFCDGMIGENGNNQLMLTLILSLAAIVIVIFIVIIFIISL